MMINLQNLIRQTPISQARTADLIKQTWTFSYSPGAKAAPGAHLIINALDMADAISNDMQASAGEISLYKPEGKAKARFAGMQDGDELLEISRDGIDACRLYRRFPHANGGRYSGSYWSGSLYATDVDGKIWSRTSGKYICDDFGSLVEVAA